MFAFLKMFAAKQAIQKKDERVPLLLMSIKEKWG